MLIFQYILLHPEEHKNSSFLEQLSQFDKLFGIDFVVHAIFLSPVVRHIMYRKCVLTIVLA